MGKESLKDMININQVPDILVQKLQNELNSFNQLINTVSLLVG